MRFELTREFLDILQEAISAQNIAWINENVCELHEADIAAIIDELEKEEATYLFRLLNEDTQSEVIVELDEDVREQLLQSFSNKEIADQLENLDSDDATDLIAELPADQLEEVIGLIEDPETAEEIVDLLNYAEDTAGGMMQKEFMKVHLDWPVNRCVIELRKQAEEVEKVFTIYVVDDAEKLVGFLSLKRLLFAKPNTLIADLYQNRNMISVKTGDDDEDVAKIMEKYDLVSVPVIDLQGKLVGRITIDDVVDVIKEEADKDFQMASGISEKVESSSTVWRISRARIPWLLIGLLGGILGAQVISGFEGGISKVPQLAFFIPLIAAMGGNVGVQSAAIVVQSLAKGNDQFGSIWKKIRKEMMVGMINGVLLSGLIYVITLIFGTPILGLVVSISLFTVIMFAAVFGTLIPLLLDKYKIDPALATGPFITTLNDVLGLFIYLTIGMLLFNI
ncbi:MAG: magnesium transporter [Flavobacteriales bacterium]|nr:magnesium transporter [Flavobacteriales bacterium]